MTGPELIAALEREGFTISRRSKALVWLKRGGDQLLIDSDASVDDELARELLARAAAPREG